MEKFSEIISSDNPVLVDFHATWCGPCKTMHPVLEQLKTETGDRLRIIKIDIDRNGSLASAYNIQSVPTLMLFRSGRCIWRKSGAMSLTALKNEISNTLI